VRIRELGLGFLSESYFKFCVGKLICGVVCIGTMEISFSVKRFWMNMDHRIKEND